MDPNITAQNFANMYQPFFIIQNKQSPILLQKFFPVARQPIKTKETSEINTLKTFYENSLNVVGQITPTNVQEPDIIPTHDQTPNVEEYLINPVKPTKIIQNIIKPSITAKTIKTVPVKRKADVPIQTLVKEKKKVFPQRTNNVTSNNDTSVHLLKVGNKYHSIGNLSEEQMKMVKNALENIRDPVKDALEPTYDAATNTKITYKVVSPNDLKLVSQNKIIIGKGSISDTKKGLNNDTKNNNFDNTKKVNANDANDDDSIYSETEKKEEKEEPIITRSGRKVKIPKHIQVGSEEAKAGKQKVKKSYAQCFDCATEFNTVYRLQQHYEMHPSHIPSHQSLFDCLLTIVNASSAEDQADVLLRQLEDIITKLKSSLPCMLTKMEGVETKSCVISKDVGRLLSLNPGNYDLNIEALSCINKASGTCKHNVSKPQTVSADVSKPSQLWLSKHKEETAKEQDEICARTNSIEKWPPFTRRVWKYKKSLLDKNKVNPNKETEIIQISDDMNAPANTAQDQATLEAVTLAKTSIDSSATSLSQTQTTSPDFDLSSPPTQNQPSEVYTPFQINLSKIAKYDGQLLRPELFTESARQTKSDHSLQGILQHLTTKTSIGGNSFGVIQDVNRKTVSEERCFERPKTWSMENIQSQDSYQTDACIRPTMIHIRDAAEPCPEEPPTKHTPEMDGVLNLSDSLISEPLNDCLNFSELRHSSIEDLPLDLFNFNNP